MNYTPLKISKFINTNNSPSNNLKSTSLKSSFTSVIFALCLIVTVGLSIYLYAEYQKTQKQLTQATLDNSAPLVEMIGKLVILPKDETPTIATVTDQGQLPNQTFFKEAANGDKILVYLRSKKAILYRPSVNKIVAIGPVSEDKAKSEVSGASTSSASLTLSPSPYYLQTTPKLIYRAVSPTPNYEQSTINNQQLFYPSLTPTPFP